MSSEANWRPLLKKRYGRAVNPLPSEDTIASLISFSERTKTGDKYTFPVKVQNEHGATHNIAHDAFDLLAARDSVEKSAELEGSEILLRGQVAYGVATKMSTGKGESPEAYDQAVGRKILNLIDSGEIYREANLLYGPGTTGAANLGVVASVITESSTTLVVTITRASWAGGFWKQMIGAAFDFYSAGGTPASATAPCVLSHVNDSNTRLTFVANSTDISNALFDAGDQIFFAGARVKSCVGLQGILENTGSLFGIDASQYPQWKGVSYPVAGALSFDKVIEGLGVAHENGLSDGTTLLVNPRTWTDLMTDEVALRRYLSDGNGKRKARPGFSELEFESNVGVIRIRTHRFMKQGIAMAVPFQKCARVGSSDLTFSVPGSKNEWFWKELDSKAGFELRMYSDQGVVCEVPYQSVIYTGITNTSDTVPA